MTRSGAAAASAETTYALVLFVSAGSTSSARAIRQVQALCEKRIRGRHSLAVVDVNHETELVPQRVLATPTLLRRSPAPERLVVGDFADEDRVLAALGIPADLPADQLGPDIGSVGEPDG